MAKSTTDRELQAMGAILGALEGLDGESIQRVLDYVLGRLNLAKSSRTFGTAVAAPVPATASEPSHHARRLSIRDLKEEKQPESSNQMAAIVAYYLSELAPDNEQKDDIATEDLEKYFKQAGFKLPSALHKTLPNASAAGYFEPAARGRYRLNPVGYNLVVHGLPRGQGAAAATRPRRARKNSRKSAKR
jgi:hypothetical protein